MRPGLLRGGRRWGSGSICGRLIRCHAPSLPRLATTPAFIYPANSEPRPFAEYIERSFAWRFFRCNFYKYLLFIFHFSCQAELVGPACVAASAGPGGCLLAGRIGGVAGGVPASPCWPSSGGHSSHLPFESFQRQIPGLSVTGPSFQENDLRDSRFSREITAHGRPFPLGFLFSGPSCRALRRGHGHCWAREGQRVALSTAGRLSPQRLRGNDWRD